MEATTIFVTGLPNGFYASLSEAGLNKDITQYNPATGERVGLLVDAEQRISRVLAIANRNSRGELMQLTLGLVAGPSWRPEEAPAS